MTHRADGGGLGMDPEGLGAARVTRTSWAGSTGPTAACAILAGEMPRFALVTFGCQMNRHDSERLRELMVASGYHEVPSPDQADLVLLNTCSVREKAVQKLRSELGRLGRLKRRRPGLLLGVTGCVAQEQGARLLSKLPFLDLVVGPDCLPELPDLLRELEDGSLPRVRVDFDLTQPRFLSARPGVGRQSPTAYVTVAKGCDEGCTFCIVPQTRGPERHRPSAEIVTEIQGLVRAGVREVTLLGQTVNGYQDPQGRCADFAGLLRLIVELVPDLWRLRYTSPHPRYLGERLMLAHQELEPLCRHVHLPVQSGSDRVLKRMVRRYTRAEYLGRVDSLRQRVAGVSLSTDVIVGFPGETADDFARTLALIQEVVFAGVFGFKYSPRPGTPALNLGDDVSETEKSRRLTELFALSDRLLGEHLERLVGRHATVLVEGPTNTGVYTGRTERNEIVHFAARSDPTGQRVEVRITEAFKHSLGAVVVDEAQAQPLPTGRPKLLRVL
jgi:tRNA-2-methylthio-N6-dimethylallyladenosine synthase